MDPSEQPPRRRTRSAPFRPRFTLTLLYLVGFFVLFAMILALPDLIEGARQLGPGPEELSDAELEQAREISRRALSGGKLFAALGASVIAVGLGAFRGVLPGLRGPGG